MTILLQPSEKFVEQDHLPAVLDDPTKSLGAIIRSYFRSVEEEGMIRRFLEFHRNVEQRDSRIRLAQRLVVLHTAPSVQFQREV